jgi:hypothetical protein
MEGTEVENQSPRRQINLIKPLHLLRIIMVGALDVCREVMEFLLAQIPQRYLEMTAAGGMVLIIIVAEITCKTWLLLEDNKVKPMFSK